MLSHCRCASKHQQRYTTLHIDIRWRQNDTRPRRANTQTLLKAMFSGDDIKYCTEVRQHELCYAPHPSETRLIIVCCAKALAAFWSTFVRDDVTHLGVPEKTGNTGYTLHLLPKWVKYTHSAPPSMWDNVRHTMVPFWRNGKRSATRQH